jgi:glycosyltransferase involved in cell wall biosynthesis
MDTTNEVVEVSVIVPARNEEANLSDCLQSLTGQSGVSYDIIVVDDHSTDRTSEIARHFPVRVIEADPLPPGWTGKCNACWTGSRFATGKWLLFTDADTRHTPESIATGLAEAKQHAAALLSYSPKQEVHTFAERALMPVVFAELAATFRPKQVSDPNFDTAAANGQYLLVRRDVYDSVGGHSAIAKVILEDVALARLVKRAGYRLWFRLSNVVSTRMYRNFEKMWEGWTKNLVLLFPDARRLALKRSLEFLLAVGSQSLITAAIYYGSTPGLILSSALFAVVYGAFLRRIRRAHFDWLSNALAIFGLPLFAVLLLRSYICHKRGAVAWKGRVYGSVEPV